MAACYALAGESVGLLEIVRGAALDGGAPSHAQQLAACRSATPAGIPHFYLEELVQLVLDEDAQPYLFNSAPATEKHPSLYAIYLKIDERAWRPNVLSASTRCDCAFKVGSLSDGNDAAALAEFRRRWRLSSSYPRVTRASVSRSVF